MTEHERAQTRAGEAVRMVDRLFDQAPIGLAIWDRELRYLRINERLAEMNGLSPDEHLGRTILEVLPHLGTEIARTLRSVLATGEPILDLEVSGETPAAPGLERHWLASYHPLREDGGHTVGVGAVVIEITEQKHAEAERDRSLERERHARLAAERAQRRSGLLAEAGSLLGSSLDYQATLEHVTRLVVPGVADWCVIDMVEDGGPIRRLAAAHVEPAKVELAWELDRRYPPDPRSPVGVPQVIRTGEPQLLAEIPDELLTAAARDEEHLRILRELDLRSAMLVPLRARGRVLGALTFVSTAAARRYGEDDLSLAQELADRCALAVDNARLYRERSYVARALQEGLLPSRLPDIPGLEVTARYQAAGAGNEVGGDFFDVFNTGEREWMVAIGDVAGKGPEAAAITALARYTIRAAALHDSTPTEVLRFLNQTILREHGTERFCTVALARLRETEDAPRLEVASGGHPLPLRVRRDGDVEHLGEPGTLLGAVADPVLSSTEVKLQDGDKVVLYTDGVIEAHTPEGMLGTERLASVLAACAGLDTEQTADEIERTVHEASTAKPRDDIAIVVVGVRARPGAVGAGEGVVEEVGGDSGRPLTLRVPGGPQAPSAARAALAELEPHLDPVAFWNARLLTSEIVTNSVRHARAGPEDWIGLDVALSADAVRVEVHDQGPGFSPQLGNAHVDSVSGRGLLLVEELADRWGVREGGSRVWFEIARA